MTSTVLTLALVTALAADPPSFTGREPNSFAPSLPQLTDEEEAKIDKIIDRFIEFDIGALRGADAKSAKDNFDKLGPEATPALLRGLNRAAAIDHSCPALVIARKLDRFLNSSSDPELLQFAHENIGADVVRSRHTGILKDLKFSVMLRKSALARAGVTKYQGGAATPEPGRTTIKPLGTLSDVDLATAAGSERGPKLKRILTELGQRQSEDALNALAAAAGFYEADVQDAARDALLTNLSRRSPDVIRARLKDDRPEMRVAASSATGSRGLIEFGSVLIDLLSDDEGRVRDAAHLALVKLNKGGDLGPAAKASDSEKAAAAKRWREWLSKQGQR